ncbi:WXG100 family type VII secretion target [Mycolicibacterium sediminis]|uniref:ESAT-6-like protein n=1 Tax=Mycolicibacterium sediminis TaxID=1286180 RepID=A0A7I7QLG6_9MYCO|nr:ESAT-6-like protein [Mycolicibacterium sediminis]
MLADNSLRVDPVALTDGAQQFRQTHEALHALLARLPGAEDALRGKWTGSAATRGTAMWSDLHDVFSAHIDQLAGDADTLQTAARIYRNRDEQQRADIDRQV